MTTSNNCHAPPSAFSANSGASRSSQLAAALAENHQRFLEFLKRRVSRSEDAEEILQDAYLRSLTRGGSLRDEEATTAWFYRLLRNALVDSYRRRGAEARALQAANYELAGADRQGTSPAVDEELLQVVCTCIGSLIGTLRPSHADAIRQVDLDGRNPHDYAREAGITPNNAAVRLHRARQALKARLMETCGACAKHGCVDCQCDATSACG